jgi:N utilization substance protein B
MISRRHLRIKAMHCLYAFFMSDKSDFKKADKELHVSIEKVYEMYLLILSLVPELVNVSDKIIEEAKQKRLPTKEDLNPNLKFISNRVIRKIAENAELKRQCDARKISWKNEKELVKRTFLDFKLNPIYASYMESKEDSYEEDKKFVSDLVSEFLIEFEPLMYYFEEKSIYWGDDLDPVLNMLIKTVKSFSESATSAHPLQKLYKDGDDEEFVTKLFHQTILHGHEYDSFIDVKAENWDLERIAFMDILLLKMAITEAVYFPSIPVKVTLNEYIELSKSYSSPKSKLFINGLLDKLFAEFKKSGKIIKTGRGLIE